MLLWVGNVLGLLPVSKELMFKKFVAAIAASLFFVSVQSSPASALTSSGVCSDSRTSWVLDMNRSGARITSVLTLSNAGSRSRWDMNWSYSTTSSDFNISYVADRSGNLRASHRVTSGLHTRMIVVANLNNKVFCSAGGTV